MAIQLSSDSSDKLTALREKEEENLVSILSHKYNIAYINLEGVDIDHDGLGLIPEEKARAAKVAVFKKNAKNLSMAIRTPNNTETQHVIQDLTERGFKIEQYMVSQKSLDSVWAHYKNISLAVETEAGLLDVSSNEVKSFIEKLSSLQETRSVLEEVLHAQKPGHTTRSLEVLIAGAIANHASDIHLEPTDTDVQMRYRLDGVLMTVLKIDPHSYHSLLTRIKLLSGLKINIGGSAQDGRFSVRLEDREIEIRTSLLPSNYGDSVVMRILDPRSIHVTLENLGMRPQFLEIMTTELKRPNGMILNTGPTGSGKTTTLYTFLQHVYDPGTKILTIEDPVEYHLEGIVQTQVNHKDYTFASGLRSALRQDPDIIMVGEIRDQEVASTAVHAALTGHLVFSTLHTNSAAGAYARLIDIGIEPNIVGSAVNVVMAQRLVRRLHPEHRREVPIEGADRKLIDDALAQVPDKSLIPENTSTMWIPDAPEGEIAYKGRVGVYEVIRTTPQIEESIRTQLTIRELEESARQQGFMSMKEDAILKVLEGVTTIEEVRRMLGD